MDLQRLKELEQLAGLSLDADQRHVLLAELIQLEEFASHLPEISPNQSEDSQKMIQTPCAPAALDMDGHQQRANAPAMESGFYKIPSTGGQSGDEPS